MITKFPNYELGFNISYYIVDIVFQSVGQRLVSRFFCVSKYFVDGVGDCMLFDIAWLLYGEDFAALILIKPFTFVTRCFK